MIGEDEGEITIKCNVGFWTGSLNKERIFVEKLVKSEYSLEISYQDCTDTLVLVLIIMP